MSEHSLALVILGLLLVREGIGISEPRTEWSKKHIIIVPLTVFVWWLILKVLL
jgi:hypothetical protein